MRIELPEIGPTKDNFNVKGFKMATQTSTSLTDLSIQELVRKVHAELISAEAARISRGLPVLFEVEGLELEIKFSIKRNASDSGKIDLKLVAIESGQNISAETVHSVRLRLRVPASGSREQDPSSKADAPIGLRPSIKLNHGDNDE